MKIAFVAGIFPAISQSFVTKQITGLLELGHDVQIFANSNPHQSQVHDDVLKYNLLERTHYPPALPVNKMLRRLKALCSVSRAIIAKPILTLRAVSCLLRRKGGFSYKQLYFVLPFIHGDFDIVHAHFGVNGLQSLILKEIGFRCRLVTTFYGYDIATYIKQEGTQVYQKLFELGDLFTYISETGKERILALGVNPEKIVKIPMGIDLDGIPFKERRINPGQSINVLSVGRLVEMKGREYTIRAIAKLTEKYPDLKYNIVGDGVLRDSLQALIDELGVSDSICIHGWVDDRQLHEFYDEAHIFLHTSVEASNGNVEGQGVVLAEAQAYGIPVIATNHGAFPENVIDGKSGFLVPERDIHAIAERIDYLIENPGEWIEMGKSGRQFVEGRLDIKKLNKVLEQAYKSTIT